MLASLHRRFDAIREPWREVVLLAVVLVLMLAIAQPWSKGLVIGAIGVLTALLGSRLRHLEGR
jgi:hypothetical protein